MAYKRESLEKLLILLGEICMDHENAWFKERLINLISSSEASSIDKQRDFSTYFILLKKQFKLKANKFYENIKDKSLKRQLVKDCVNMYWYQVNNDIHQMFVYAFFQFETLLNFYVHNANSYEKIDANKNYYTHSFSEAFNVSAYKNFFYEGKPIEVGKIKIWGKLIFWIYDTNRTSFLEKYSYNISNLINARNQIIHRDIYHGKQTNIESLRAQDFSAFGFYTNILKEVSTTLEKINTTVEIKPLEATKVTLPTPKVVGKIDLDKFKR